MKIQHLLIILTRQTRSSAALPHCRACSSHPWAVLFAAHSLQAPESSVQQSNCIAYMPLVVFLAFRERGREIFRLMILLWAPTPLHHVDVTVVSMNWWILRRYYMVWTSYRTLWASTDSGARSPVCSRRRKCWMIFSCFWIWSVDILLNYQQHACIVAVSSCVWLI